MNKALSKQNDFINGLGEGAEKSAVVNSNSASEWITSNLTEIKRRVADAGVQNLRKSYMEPAGYGHLVQQHFTILDNLLLANLDVMKQARHILEIAKGYYLTNMKQSFNPLYWLEVIFFLPRALVSAAGIEGSSKVFEISLKIFQISYWIALILLIVFKPEYIQTFMKAK